jgi:L-2,4-diaminobutyric acid acetyltransferase
MSLESEIRLRLPELPDGKPVHELIQRCPPLDLNSSYNYFLLCSHFRGTCVVAEQDGGICGFLSAYLLPTQPDTLFIWQMAVDSSARGTGLAGRMLDEVLARPACRQLRYIETTIAPDNAASRRVFERLAERLQADTTEETFLEARHFGGEAHDDERLIRLGPVIHS